MVLSVVGRIVHANVNGAAAAPGILGTAPAVAGNGPRADFDMAMLAQLPQHAFSASTPWYAQRRRFAGPLLREVLAAAGAQGTALRLHALNDYQVEMPVDDAQRHDVLLARLIDNQPIAVRDKGPLFVIYPFDDVPALRTAVYYGRSAWQLRTIEVR